MKHDPADDARQRRAFELRNAHYEKLAKFSSTLGCSMSDAQQIANDSLAELVIRESDPDTEPIDNVRAWLYGVAHHMAMQLFRDRRKYTQFHNIPQESLANPNLGPEKYAELMEILDAIQKLPEHHRLPLALILRGESYTEIAKILDCSIETARQRVRRARKELRTMLGD